MVNKYTVKGNEIRLFDPLDSKEAIIELLDVIYSGNVEYKDIHLIIPNAYNHDRTVKTLDDSQGFHTQRNDHKKIFSGPMGERIHVYRKKNLLRHYNTWE